MRKLCLLIVACFFSSALLAQKDVKLTKTQEADLTDAENYFADENYLAALPVFKKVEPDFTSTSSVRTNIKFKLGICYLYKSDEASKSIDYLKSLKEEDPNIPDVEFYLGRAYHLNGKYDEALVEFISYSNKKLNENDRKELNRYILYCKNAKEHISSPVDATITNIGDPVNTENSEYVPVISADESIMVFTYAGVRSTGGLQDVEGKKNETGKYFEDIFVTTKEEDKPWKEPEPIGNVNINTDGHDAAIALSSDGQLLFVYKNDPSNNGDIYSSKLEGTQWSDPQKLPGINTSKHWEGSASISSTGKFLIFASDRPGGLGGRDLYRAKLQFDGTWGDIKNLGPVINTAYNEDAPFIHPDGTYMVFSSEGHSSMGGYDIMRTDILGDSTYATPINLGYPINTPGDDRYYVVTADGKKGYYSSGKPGGYGQHDIYLVEPGIPGKKALLVLLRGTITLDDKPVEAQVKVYFDDEQNKNGQGEYASNSASGKYLVNLPAGSNYKIVYSLKGFEDQIRTLEATKVDTFLEAVIDIPFYTKKPIVMKDSSKISNSDIVKQFGDSTIIALEFYVQIAAYNYPKNFKYSHLKGKGKVQMRKLGDNITRFTIGPKFKTLNEARAYKNEIVAVGGETTDSFVLAVYQGKRVYLKDLAQIFDLKRFEK